MRDPAAILAGSPENPVVVRASYDRANRTVQIDQPTSYIALLLNDSMFSLGRDVYVKLGASPFIQAVGATVKRSKTIQSQTWKARGDRNLIFTAALGLEEHGAKGSGVWAVKSLDSLDELAMGPVKALL